MTLADIPMTNIKHTVQLMFNLTLLHTEHVCVLQFLLNNSVKNTHDTKWAACKSTFMYCT